MLTEIRNLYTKAKADFNLERDLLRKIELLDQVNVIKNINKSLTPTSHNLGSLIELGQVLTTREGSIVAVDLIKSGCETKSIAIQDYHWATTPEQKEKVLKLAISYLYFQDYEQKYKAGRLAKINTIVTINNLDWKLFCIYPKIRNNFPSVGKLSYVSFAARPLTL